MGDSRSYRSESDLISSTISADDIPANTALTRLPTFFSISERTKARQVRDLCVSLGIAMTIEDSWGGDIVTAAIAHLAHSTPEASRFTSTDFNSYVTVSIADGAPQRDNGTMRATSTSRLGISPRLDLLGAPVLEVR